jgi:DNA-binding transcriptional regulator YhcF (GntR family)
MAHKNSNVGEYPSDDDPGWSHLSANAKGTPTYREVIEERIARRAKNNAEEHFVRLGHDLTGSQAWKALGPYARDAYSWIARRYRGKNNGKIPMSVRDLADLMGVNDKTAVKAFKRLQLFGFLAVHQKGHMGLRGDEQRRATRWRLTEYRCEDGQPTRDYLDTDINEAERQYNLYFSRTPRGHDTYPDGERTRTLTGDIAKMAESEAQENRGDTRPVAPRRKSPTYPDAAQSIAGETRVGG